MSIEVSNCLNRLLNLALGILILAQVAPQPLYDDWHAINNSIKQHGPYSGNLGLKCEQTLQCFNEADPKLLFESLMCPPHRLE